ncbi:MAG: Trk family potassium uptake protein [Candidatus Omnitrophota bacterium]|nr:MAG: Trk family potassium uptake protein [Candidatus Omnitrophota bacterium]
MGYRIRLTSVHSLLAGFLLLILTGTFLLSLPISLQKGSHQTLVNALFTATSAITTTGLVVVDTGKFYSFFGQLIILVLLQIGGLGYMVFIVSVAVGLRKRLSLRNRMLFHTSLGHLSEDIIKFVKSVILFTLFFEGIGAIILTLAFLNDFPLSQAIYFGVFHAISGFCTAGFSPFSESFLAYQNNLLINFTLFVICFAGGIGFFVLYDLYNLWKRVKRRLYPRVLSIHSRFVIILSALIIFTGGFLILFSVKEGFKHPFLVALFQTISASTGTGFSTTDISKLPSLALFTLILLMFIGASPGSTGGGIKTSTFGIMLLSLFSLLRGKENVNLFNRDISPKVVNKAFGITLIALLVIILGTLILLAYEKVEFLRIFFEVVSAFGTVGLSTGITPSLSTVSKLVLSLIMLIGRVGPLAIGYSLIKKSEPLNYKYAEGEILVG